MERGSVHGTRILGAFPPDGESHEYPPPPLPTIPHVSRGALGVRRLDDPPEAWWDAICLRARSPWHASTSTILQGEFGVRSTRLVAEMDGSPVGVLAVHYAGARRLKLMDPLVGTIARVPAGPAVDSAPAGTTSVLVDAAHQEIAATGAVSATWRMDLPDPEAEGALRALGYQLRPYGVGLFTLPASAQDLEAAIHSKSRNLVRKARKAGVEVAPEPGVETLLPLLNASFRRSGLEPRDAEYVRRSFESQACEVLVARLKGIPIAALMWHPFGTLGRYMFHGRTDGDTAGASNLLLLEMFRRGIEKGVRLFHAGDVALDREKDEKLLSITHFKERMGFRVVPTYEASIVLRPIGKALRDSALGAWRRLKSGGGEAV